MKRRTLVLMVVLSGFLGLGCRSKTETPDLSQNSGSDASASPRVESFGNLSKEERNIKNISDSEGLLQALSGDLKALTNSFKSTPSNPLEFVSTEIEYIGIVPNDFGSLVDAATTTSDDPIAVSFEWPISDSPAQVGFSEVWRSILDGQRFEDSQLGVLKASFPGEPGYFELETKFEGRIRLADGRLVGSKGYQTLGWELNDQDKWMLVSWRQTKMKMAVVQSALFDDVTERAIPDDSTREKILSSSHQEMIVQRSSEENGTNKINEARSGFGFFSDWESTAQYPAASVVDIDQDGFDDLFVTDRWQSPQLLRNNGDGTFEDITESSGIEIPEFATCAYFLDFDNDGDSDLFVGFSMVASKFYENVKGVFKPHEAINKVLEESRFVLACSVADVNGDGLLDIYLSTYAFGVGRIDKWIDMVTRPDERLKTRLKMERGHNYFDRAGPPNILLMNRGDTFDWVEMDDVLKQYRNSYQTVWMDFDVDGDLDLYICNDFAQDMFLRNDTPRESFEPKFVDVTGQVAPSMLMGFGMGASWGDFDNDGDLDLYVSNMYSKAGNRIIGHLDGVDEKTRVAAHGNFLYENRGPRWQQFKQVAGSEPDQQHVASVGWSFGGQFADFDNDGQLDLYVPSGFYSAPIEVRSNKDL